MPPTQRKRCRICANLAGMSRDICNGCRMAEVRKHIKRGKHAHTVAKNQVVQDAYSRSLRTAPNSEREQLRRTDAPTLGAGVGSGGAAAHVLATEACVHAVLAGFVQSQQGIVEEFYRQNHKSFYHHMRSLLRALEIKSRDRAWKKRKTPSRHSDRKPNPRAESTINRAMAKTLQTARRLMGVELIPLALKMGCSQAQIWHLEKPNNCIGGEWVQAYATALGLPSDGLWTMVDALEPQIDENIEQKELLLMFVDLVLRYERPALRGVGA